MPMITVLLALTGVAEATNIAVPAQQPTIAAAVAALSGVGPHQITITQDGTYDEADTIVINNMDLTIIGNGADNTVIRVLNPLATAVFRQTGGRLAVNGVTISGDASAQAAGLGLIDNICYFAVDRTGIQAINTTLEVNDSELRCFFTLGSGGGIYGEDSEISVDDSTFEQNIALSSGGHIYAGGSNAYPMVEISDTDFRYGFAADAGGAVYMGNVEPHLTGNSFRYNDAVVRGGAVSISTTWGVGPVEIYQNTFENNAAFAVLEFTVFDFNEQFGDTGNGLAGGTIDFGLITGDGGAVYVDAENVDIWANLFCGNYSDQGGAVHLSDPLESTVQNNIFNDNWAIHYGGGTFVRADSAIVDPLILNNTFNANSAGTGLPPIEGLVVYGGGGHAFFDGTRAVIRNNILSNTPHGGGVGGVDGDNFIVGDPLDITYNLWFANSEDFAGPSNLVSDFDAHTLNQTNVFDQDPNPTWVGSGDLDCYPDAFYPEWGSPAINRGDLNAAYDDVDGSRNDIGYTGGPDAPVLDRDNDGYMNTIDCNDTSAQVHPGAVETCNLMDDNCDGAVDEGLDNTWVPDVDGDGYGTDADPVNDVITSCTPPGGVYVAAVFDANGQLIGDCDDTNAAINPAAVEICDGLDNECDGTADNPEVVLYTPYYIDNDGDGFGIDPSRQELCADPGPGFTTNPGDCNDAEVDVNPQAAEICDGLDNDCNGSADIDAIDAKDWYLDSDADSYGTGDPLTQCNAPSDAHVNVGGDCDDNNEVVNPAAAEVCDSVDNDCDTLIDDNATDGTKYYTDADGDGFLDESSEVSLCEGVDPPDGYVVADGAFDCDDTDPLVGECVKECSCQTGANTPTNGLLLAVASLLVVRRRRQA